MCFDMRLCNINTYLQVIMAAYHCCSLSYSTFEYHIPIAPYLNSYKFGSTLKGYFGGKESYLVLSANQAL